MKKVLSVFTLISLATSSAYASKVAVVDSGTDFSHKYLQSKKGSNEKESQNGLDDDSNGKTDDVNGWNFITNTNKFFDKSLLTEKMNPDVFKLMVTIGRIDLNIPTVEDKAFIEKIKALPEAKKRVFLSQLDWYGQYSHGTHCSGIITLVNPDAKLVSDKVFKDTLMPFNVASFAKPTKPTTTTTKPSAEDEAVKKDFYIKQAAQTNGFHSEIAKYHTEQKIDAANYSLGMQFSSLAKSVLNQLGNTKPTQAEIEKEAQLAFSYFKKGGDAWLAAAKNTFFAIAAGNYKEDNDKTPVSPASFSAPNSITVAATVGYRSLADFTNYGKKSVHIAAPGVAIRSTVPSLANNLYLPMSGTSMATPFVTGVASKMKDSFPGLTPAVTKTIMMGTVDKKAWLTEKVVSGGIINPNRCVAAAVLLKNKMTVTEAIAKVNKEIQDMPEDTAITPPSMRSRTVDVTPEMQELADMFRF